jgi:hypothetical protein
MAGARRRAYISPPLHSGAFSCTPSLHALQDLLASPRRGHDTISLSYASICSQAGGVNHEHLAETAGSDLWYVLSSWYSQIVPRHHSVLRLPGRAESVHAGIESRFCWARQCWLLIILANAGRLSAGCVTSSVGKYHIEGRNSVELG